MSCCCEPSDDPERIYLRDRSRSKRDDDDIDRDLEIALAHAGYQEIPGSSLDDVRESTFSSRKICCGYGFAFLGAITLATSLVCTEIIGVSMPYSELNGFRFTAQLLNISPLLIGCKKCDVRVERPLIGWLILGAALLVVNNYAYYGTVYYLPLDVASGIICCLVLIFNYCISCIVDKTVHWYEFIAFLMCISGVIMIAQPKFIFQYVFGESFSDITNHTYENITWRPSCEDNSYMYTYMNSSGNESPFPGINNRHLEEGRPDIIGFVLCLVTAITSTAYMQVIKFKLIDLNIFVFNFWACLLGILTSFVAMAFTETPLFPTSPFCIAFVLIHAFSAASHMITLYRAFQLIDPVLSSLILTLRVVFIFIYQYTLLSWFHVSTAHANILEVFGSIMLFIGAILVGIHQLIQIFRKKKKEKIKMERNIIEEDFEFVNRIHY